MTELALYNFQVRAKNFWLRNKNVYLAIDMGLGKTPICLHTINQIGKRALVVSPLTVAYKTWPNEIHKWDLDGDLSIEVLHGPDKDQLFEREASIHVINYEGLPWLYKRLYDMFKAKKPLPYKVLVLDESTLAKSPTSKRFGYLCAMRDMFEYIVCLSGTPSPNSLMDLWSQYYLLDKGKSLGKDFGIFRTRHFERTPYRKYDWSLRFGAEAAIHKNIAPITFRLQSSDYISLPERKFNYINLELPEKERRRYNSFRKDFVLSLEEATIESFNKASLSSKLRQFVQGAVYENLDNGERKTHYLHGIKVRALEQLLDMNKGKNFLCAIQFKFEVEMLQKAFPGTPAITGSSKSSDSNKYIDLWNAGKLPLLIVHPKSVSRGLNLQYGGHTCVWFAPTYSLDDYMQFNKRLHRTGQKETVVIHHLVLDNTIDEFVYSALSRKDMTQQKLLNYLREETKKWMA